MVPALAVADALRASGADVSFIGAAERSEAELVPAAGYEIDFLRVRGLDRRNPLRAVAALGLAARAVPAARTLLRRQGADVVLGGGGYVAAPVGLAGLGMRLPLVLTEADRHLGLANRVLARRARRVCLAFPIAGLDGRRFVVTGRPVPAAVVGADRTAARDRFGIAADAHCLLVVGGSQGALSINRAAIDGLLGADRDFDVLHVTGRRDFEWAQEAADGVPGYTVLAYEPNLGDTLAACDLVLARSGASVFELAAAGRPAILVPYPFATARHQHLNAQWMADAGAAIMLEDSDLSGATIRRLATELLADGERLRRMGAASAALAQPDAADRVAAEVLATVGG